ncbi:hypothetical protein BRADI_4g28521v3 [Brachypodium distachyon]|uniref:Uncharacterized protein n=1 Tax=Brachypodium distachyon TaxID=15368 RepID=A0A0Q3PKM0_BRADI|nr:hypothetical protein BRADI_4g28521v3 [Brachypodium distachyon]
MAAPNPSGIGPPCRRRSSSTPPPPSLRPPRHLPIPGRPASSSVPHPLLQPLPSPSRTGARRRLPRLPATGAGSISPGSKACIPISPHSGLPRHMIRCRSFNSLRPPLPRRRRSAYNKPPPEGAGPPCRCCLSRGPPRPFLLPSIQSLAEETSVTAAPSNRWQPEEIDSTSNR